MKYIELKEVFNGGSEPRYFANSKRVTREEFYAIKHAPKTTLECFSNAIVNGVQTFYSTARIES